MLIKLLLITFSLCICVEINLSTHIICRRQVSNEISDSKIDKWVNSFSKLMKNLRHFFRITNNEPVVESQCEKTRKKIKKALHNFIAEVFYDKPANNCNTQMRAGSELRNKPIEEPQLMSEDLLILEDGYSAKAHTVQTGDGYVLRLYRIIPAPSSKNCTEENNNIVILHHGLLGCSDDWLHLGPKKALPYLLTDAGYDVWLTNARGNKYSRKHITYAEHSPEFWDFSFHEIGTLDLPVVIDYVKDTSVSDIKISFVGFSIGATALLVLLSTLPKYNEVLKSATLLAPLAFMYQIKGPLKLLAEFHELNAANSLSFLGVNEFMPIQGFPQIVIEKYCRGDDGEICLNPLLLIANGGKKITNKNVLDKVKKHLPRGASVKTILHYMQLINSGQFIMFDYVTSNNSKEYLDLIPPRYDLSNVKIPIVLISSSDDWLSTQESVFKLLPQLPYVAVHHIVKKHEFSHTDFIWGDDAPEQVFQLVVELLNSTTLSDGSRIVI